VVDENLERKVRKLEQKLDTERKRRESVEAMLAVKNGEGDVDLSEETLNKLVAAAIKNAITVHGPIDANLAGSAAKRVVGELKGHFKRQVNGN